MAPINQLNVHLNWRLVQHVRSMSLLMGIPYLFVRRRFSVLYTTSVFEILVKFENFGLKSKILSKIELFVKKR